MSKSQPNSLTDKSSPTLGKRLAEAGTACRALAAHLAEIKSDLAAEGRRVQSAVDPEDAEARALPDPERLIEALRLVLQQRDIQHQYLTMVADLADRLGEEVDAILAALPAEASAQCVEPPSLSNSFLSACHSYRQRQIHHRSFGGDEPPEPRRIQLF